MVRISPNVFVNLRPDLTTNKVLAKQRDRCVTCHAFKTLYELQK